MSLICTPLKGSPPATLATCCWGKRPFNIHKHTHTHAQWKQHKTLFKAIVKHKDWGRDVDPFPSNNCQDSFERPPLVLFLSSVPEQSIRHFPFYSSLPLHMCLSYTKFLLNLLNGIGTRRTAPRGLSHSGDDWVVSPTEDGKEKCLSHLSTSSRRWTGKRRQDYCTVNTQRRAHFLRIRYEENKNDAGKVSRSIWSAAYHYFLDYFSSFWLILYFIRTIVSELFVCRACRRTSD